MKRKIHIAMFMAAGLLLAAACTDDGLDTSENGTAAQTGDEVTVTFSLELEDAAGTNTRAVSDGTGINTLVYAIYSNGKALSIDGADKNGQVTETVDFSSGASSIDLEVVLVNGQTCTAVFWAQNSNCTAYKTSDLTAVTVDYSDAANNDDTRDAFYAAHEFTAGGGGTKSVSMKRPFAQINVGVTSEDWTAAVDSGITIEKSSVTISNAATSLNLLTGAVSGSETVTFNSAAIPGETDTDDTYLTVTSDDGTETPYRWLSATYVLLSQTTLDELNYTFSTASTETDYGTKVTEIALKVTDLPVQSNYKTNILGNLLTSSTATTTYHITTETELTAAAANSGTYTLANSINLSKTLSVTASDVTIDLNGNSLTSSDSFTGTLIKVSNEEGGSPSLTIDGTGTVGGAVYVENGSLTVNGGTFEGKLSGNVATVEITDGTFEGDLSFMASTASITGGTFNGNVANSGGEITIEGGSFTNADATLSDDSGTTTIKGGTFDCKLSNNGGTFKIEDGIFNGAISSDSIYTEITGGTFNSGIECNGGTVAISGGTFNGIIKGNGGTITITGGNFYNQLSVYYNGTINISSGTFSADATLVSNSDAGTITVTGGTFSYDPSAYVDETSCTITDNNDGTYTVTETNT